MEVPYVSIFFLIWNTNSTQVKIRGHPDDYNEPDNHKETKTVRNNGFNPTWKQSFVFNIKVPEVAFLEFKVNYYSA